MVLKLLSNMAVFLILLWRTQWLIIGNDDECFYRAHNHKKHLSVIPNTFEKLAVLY